MGNFIWTKHVIERNKQRGISENWINQTINNPDDIAQTEDRKNRYKKRFSDQTVTVIVKTNEKGENIILSTWIYPPNLGTKDFRSKQRYEEMKKASLLRKFWLTFLNQIGL